MEPKYTEQRRVDTSSTPASSVYTPLSDMFTGINTVLSIKDAEISDPVKVVSPLGDLKIEVPGNNTAMKFDTGKLNWSLLPWDTLEEIIKVLEFGAGKYSPWNWAEGEGFKYSRLFNSSMRHFIAWFWKKEDNDPETGLSHMAHLGCNVLFLLHYILNGNKFKNNDDRSIK